MMRVLLLLACALLVGGKGQTPPVPMRPGLDKAIFFATDRYDHPGLRDLQNPIRNARALATVLARDYGFDTLVVENPTLLEIENQLYAYQEAYQTGRYSQDGQLLVFFSGHGDTRFGEGFFLPRNADPTLLRRTALPYSYWRGFLDEMPCKHVLVAIDACHSVYFDPERNRDAEDFIKRVGERSEGEKLLDDHRAKIARLFFTSDVTGDETPDKSSFAKKFEEALMTDGGVDGILTSSDVFSILFRAQPTPHRGEFGRDTAGSSFLFIRQKVDVSDIQAELKVWKQAKQQNSISAYQEFLSRYPGSDFAELAEDNVRSLEAMARQRKEADAWTQAQRLNTVAAYESFRQNWPRSAKASEAKSRIQALEQAAAEAWDDAAWERAQSADTKSAYQRYLDQFPAGLHRDEAQAGIDTLEIEARLAREYQAWEEAKAEGTDAAYRAFLKAYPESSFADLAKARLKTATPETRIDLPPMPKMIKIDGGRFMMGSREGYKNEKPVHEVQVSTFLLAETEVTFAQYDYYCEQTGQRKPRDEGWGRGNRPVIKVSWTEAQAYIEWLNQQPGQSGWRLPSEAEWEYAAGGGANNRTKWAGTNSVPGLRSYGNYDGTGGRDTYERTALVKSFSPNDLGLYDMSGNVWEWCQDWYGSDYYAASPVSNPKGPNSGTNRVLRGGSWYNGADLCRVALRLRDHPDDRGSIIGFRLARSY